MVQKCAEQFRFYEKNHRQKALTAMSPADSQAAMDRAEVNRDMAEQCEALLAPAPLAKAA